MKRILFVALLVILTAISISGWIDIWHDHRASQPPAAARPSGEQGTSYLHSDPRLRPDWEGVVDRQSDAISKLEGALTEVEKQRDELLKQVKLDVAIMDKENTNTEQCLRLKQSEIPGIYGNTPVPIWKPDTGEVRP